MMMMSKLLFYSRLRSSIKCVKLAKNTIFEADFQGKFSDKAFAEEVVNQHIANVRELVPSGKIVGVQC